MAYDLYNNITSAIALENKIYDNDGLILGNVIDTFGYESVVFLLFIGFNDDPDGSFEFRLMESDTPDNFTQVPTQYIQNGFPPPEEVGAQLVNRIFKMGYIGTKQYLRLDMSVQNTENGLQLGVMVVEGNPHSVPTSPEATS